MSEEFVMRPKENRYAFDTAIRIKDGNLVVTDPLSRRVCFALSDPDGPKRVSRYTVIGSRMGGSSDSWAVLDGQGRSFLDASARLWPADEFKRLAEVGGFDFEEHPAMNTEIPVHRPDYVEVSNFRGGMKSVLLIWFVLPVLVCIGIAGLISGFPWFWPLVFLAWGGWAIATSIQEALTVQRNRPHLPVDEGGLGLTGDQPGPPPDLQRAIKERDIWRRAATWAALAIIPPLIAALR